MTGTFLSLRNTCGTDFNTTVRLKRGEQILTIVGSLDNEVEKNVKKITN